MALGFQSWYLLQSTSYKTRAIQKNKTKKRSYFKYCGTWPKKEKTIDTSGEDLKKKGKQRKKKTKNAMILTHTLRWFLPMLTIYMWQWIWQPERTGLIFTMQKRNAKSSMRRWGGDDRDDDGKLEIPQLPVDASHN